MTLKLFVLIQIFKSQVISSQDQWFALHAMRIVCLLKAVSPAWVTKTILIVLVINNIHHSGSFDVWQAKVKRHCSAEPASPVPRALNKRYSARGGPDKVSFVFIT